MIISGPNLVGGSITDLVVPVHGDHGPYEYSGRLFAACITNDTLGGTVPGGAGFFYSSTSPDGPSNWTRETSGYPSGVNYLYLYATPDFNETNGTVACFAKETSSSNYGIGKFSCSSRTYGAIAGFNSCIFSSALPILVRQMPDGSTIVVAGGASGGSIFYRFAIDGTASGPFTIFSSSYPIAIVDDRVSNVAHVMFRGDPGATNLYYAKIFSDNSVSVVSTVSTAASYAQIGAEGASNYGKSYCYFEGKMFVQARNSSGVDVIVSDVLTNADEIQTFSILSGIAAPTPVSGGTSQADIGNLATIYSLNKLYLAVPALQYDGGGAVSQDQVLVAEYSGSGFGTVTVGADFLASPPTIPPPGTIPAPGNEYSHFHSIHGLDDGTLGTICDFIVDDGVSVLCTSYYANFSTGGGGEDKLILVGDTLQFWWSDYTAYDFPQISYSIVDAIELLDNLFYSIDGNPKAGESDTLALSDHVGIGLSSISGGGGTGTGDSGGFSGGGPNNHPTYCIFEFYEMMTPENVETLPVPKRYDQLGPMRFDKIAKIFGFRIRLIMNGNTTVMPYRIFGDDSPTAAPGYSTPLFSDSFTVRPGIDNTYEIQLPKSINSDIVRLEIGPTTDTFHRYDVLMKIQTSGMQGQSKWLPIR